MNRQRGVIAAGWIWLVGSIIVLALVFGITKATTSYLNGVRAEAKKAGQDSCDAAYKERDNEQLQKVIAERDKLLQEKEAVEKLHQNQISQKEQESAKRLAQKDADYNAFITDINAGRVVWRDPGKTGTGTTECDQSTSPQTTTNTSIGSGRLGGGGLSTEAEGFLASEARRANKIVEKLNLCRGVLAIEREKQD